MQDSIDSLVFCLFGVPEAVCLAVDEAGSLQVFHQTLVFFEDCEVLLALLSHSLVFGGQGLDGSGEFVELQGMICSHLVH